MIAWQMADELDFIVQEILKKVPKYEYKTKRQIDNASDSIGSNFVEGYIKEALYQEFREKAIKTGYIFDRLIDSLEKKKENDNIRRIRLKKAQEVNRGKRAIRQKR